MPSPFFNGLGNQLLQIFKDSEPATLFSQETDDSRPVSVIFHARHQDTDRNGIPYGAPRPVAWIEISSNPPKYGDILTIGEVDYVIRETKPDSLELIELVLSEP